MEGSSYGTRHRELDIRMLRVLQLLLQERNVSRVAEKLGQSQPSTSLTLKRLRDIIGDPLLVRSGNSLVPTANAMALMEAIDSTLAGFDRIIGWRDDIAPRMAARKVRIVMSNAIAMLFAPSFVERIRAEAPNIDVEFRGVPADGSLAHALESGEVDIVIGNWPSPAENLRMAPLFETDIVCMTRRSHPLAKNTKIDMEAYLAQAHISPTPAVISQWSPIDGKLAQLNLRRTIAVSVAEYALIPYVLARSDLVFTTGRPFAEHLATLMPFTIFDAPSELGRMKFYMLWHQRAHNSGFEKWLRNTARKVAGQIQGKKLSS